MFLKKQILVMRIYILRDKFKFLSKPCYVSQYIFTHFFSFTGIAVGYVYVLNILTCKCIPNFPIYNCF